MRKGWLGRFLRHRFLRYGVLLGLGLGVVWVPVVLYVVYAKDIYRSSSSILIPGSGVGSSLNLDSVGQATTSVASAYSSSSVDPKVNYKAIMTSSTVLKDAARRAGLEPGEYGEPRIKLVDQTSILSYTFESATAEEAHLKTTSLYESFEAELSRLRNDERERLHLGNLSQLEEYQHQMGVAQERLLEFQASAGTVSAEQLSDLLAAIDRMRDRRSELELEIASSRGRIDALSRATGVDPALSANVVKLQQDQVLDELLKVYSILHAEHLDKATALGASNPKIALLRSRLVATETALKERAADLLGFFDDGFVDRFLPAGSGNEPSLFHELVALEADIAADINERETLESLLAELKGSVQTSAEKVARFEELERGYRVAETVFLTALAKIDLGKSDIYASYPMTQVLVPPTLPARPEKLHRLFALLGAAAGSAFLILALAILWKREALLRRLQRSA